MLAWTTLGAPSLRSSQLALVQRVVERFREIASKGPYYGEWQIYDRSVTGPASEWAEGDVARFLAWEDTFEGTAEGYDAAVLALVMAQKPATGCGPVSFRKAGAYPVVSGYVTDVATLTAAGDKLLRYLAVPRSYRCASAKTPPAPVPKKGGALPWILGGIAGLAALAGVGYVLSRG